MKNNQKGFVNILLIGVVVIFVAVGIYFVGTRKSTPLVDEESSTQTPNSTSQGNIQNSKTYKNSYYGFEFNYPENLVITGESDKRNFDLNPDDLNDKLFDWFDLHLSDKRDRQIFNFSLSINSPAAGFGGLEVVSSTSITIGGVQAGKEIMQEIEGEYKGSKSVLYQFRKGSNGYMVYATGSYELADTILSTFKFTK